MTLSELKKKVAESKTKGWFQSVVFSLDYPYLEYQITLTGIASVYDYILKQLKAFADLGEIPPELETSKIRFENLKVAIIQMVNDDKENNQKWNNEVLSIGNINYRVIPADTSEAEFLTNVFHQHRIYYASAYNYVIGSTRTIDKQDLIGYLLAYEFTFKENPKLTNRKDVEQRAISKLKTEFESMMSNSETELTEYLSKANEKVNQKSIDIDAFVNKKEESYTDWFDRISVDVSVYLEDTKKNVAALEELYKEKLKLEAPAKYWSDRATKLRSEGNNWLKGLVASIGVAVLALILILSWISDGTIARVFEDTGTAIKWSIGVITLISFLAFGIRTFSKLTFSCFHLVRDAEEREQLTYVFLALQNEKGIDKTERHLVMQSLFSRADSGLLKDEGSPTMPGNIFDKMTVK